ncbi:MAG: TIGR02757 family protein [Deltaproteobacteria bacterium]|nr:TIGR02757 family protein [Deltaproteobacteria bacterium]MCL4874597.1 TIGR02757 family protein [bacterium]
MDVKKLKKHLDRLLRTFDRSFLATDPLEFVHRYNRPEDREIVGLVASSLAYGKVEIIKKSVSRVLEAAGPSPYRFTRRFEPEKGLRLFSGFVHRFNRGEDIACLFWFARQMIEEAGSIGGFFMEGHEPSRKNVKEALSSFSERALALDSSTVYGKKKLPPKAGVRFFFPNPADGSPCKRLNLYLRWMVRRGDGLDFGQWKGVEPCKLVMPLDTHVARISRNIGLTGRANPDWRMAEEVTDALKKLDPADPVKYDFALCRLGILDRCPRKADPGKCSECLISPICVL